MNVKPCRVMLGIFSAVAVAIPLVVAVGSAVAQERTASTRTAEPARIEKLVLERVPIRNALTQLFNMTGRPTIFTIDPAVQGNVTAAFYQAPVDEALPLLLNQVQATYRMQGDTYIISHSATGQDPFRATEASGLPRDAAVATRTFQSIAPSGQSGIAREVPPQAGPRGGVQGAPPPQPGPGFPMRDQRPMPPGGMGMMGGGTAMVEDGTFLFIVQGGMVYKLNKSDLRVVAIGGLPRPEMGRDAPVFVQPGGEVRRTSPPPPGQRARAGGGGRAK